MEDLKIYISYHRPDLIQQYNLVEDDTIKLFNTTQDAFHPYLNEFVTQMYVYKNNLFSERIGFQQYHKTISQKFYQNDFFGIRKLSDPFSLKDNITGHLASPYLYEEMQKYIKENYDEDSNIYKCFVEDAEKKRPWFVKETYILHWNYFLEIIGFLTNFIENLLTKNSITREDPDVLRTFVRSISDPVYQPEPSKHRSIGYLVEASLGLYLEYIYEKEFSNSRVLYYP